MAEPVETTSSGTPVFAQRPTCVSRKPWSVIGVAFARLYSRESHDGSSKDLRASRLSGEGALSAIPDNELLRSEKDALNGARSRLTVERRESARALLCNRRQGARSQGRSN